MKELFLTLTLFLLVFTYPADILQAQSLSVIPLDALDRVYPDQWPAVASNLIPLHVPRGGQVAFQFALRSDVTTEIAIDLSEIKDSSGNIMQGEVKLYHLLTVPCEGNSRNDDGETPESWYTYLIRKAPFDVADVLVETSNFNLPASETHSVLVDISVPTNATSGSYSGALLINGVTDETSFEFVVHKTRLLPGYELDSIHWPSFAPENLTNQDIPEWWSKEHWELLKQAGRQLYAFGDRNMIVPIFADTEGGRITSPWVKTYIESDGSYSFDFTRFNQWCQTFLDIGFEKMNGMALTGNWPLPSNVYAIDRSLLGAEGIDGNNIAVVGGHGNHDFSELMVLVPVPGGLSVGETYTMESLIAAGLKGDPIQRASGGLSVGFGRQSDRTYGPSYDGYWRSPGPWPPSGTSYTPGALSTYICSITVDQGDIDAGCDSVVIACLADNRDSSTAIYFDDVKMYRGEQEIPVPNGSFEDDAITDGEYLVSSGLGIPSGGWYSGVRGSPKNVWNPPGAGDDYIYLDPGKVIFTWSDGREQLSEYNSPEQWATFAQTPEYLAAKERWLDFLSDYFIALNDNLTAQGWMDHYTHGLIDEPRLDAEFIDLAMLSKQYLPEVGIAEAIHAWGVPHPQNLTAYVDKWYTTLSFIEGNRSIVNTMTSMGKAMGVYNLGSFTLPYPNRNLDEHLSHCRLFPWIIYLHGGTISLNWAANRYRGVNPYTTAFTYPVTSPGHNWQFYPGPDGLLPSLRMIAWRDGMHDHQLLRMLKEFKPDLAEQMLARIARSSTDYAQEPVSYHQTREQS